MKRFRTFKNGYRVDRWLLLAFFSPAFIIGGAGFLHGLINGFNGVSCPDINGMDCLNPYYQKCNNPDLCGAEYLPAGYEYNQPPWYVQPSMAMVQIIAALFGFVINDIKHNKGLYFKNGL